MGGFCVLGSELNGLLVFDKAVSYILRRSIIDFSGKVVYMTSKGLSRFDMSTRGLPCWFLLEGLTFSCTLEKRSSILAKIKLQFPTKERLRSLAIMPSSQRPQRVCGKPVHGGTTSGQ